jgi:Domain of unknown function (DUF4303)
MNDLSSFDFDEFATRLLAAARHAFKVVQLHHADEAFYVYALYAAPMHSALFASANTEQGLAEAAAAQLAQDRGRGWYNGLDVAGVGALMRDFAAEWKYHCFSAGIANFDAVGDGYGYGEHWYQQCAHVDKTLPEAEAWEALQAYVARMRDVCCGVLWTLDGEGIFGQGAARERVVLTLLMGDGSAEDKLNWAAKLNSKAVVTRYEQSLEVAAELAAQVQDNMLRAARG